MNDVSRFRSLFARLFIVVLASVTHVAVAAADSKGDPQAIVVTAVKGAVTVTSAGQARAVQQGTVLVLPATIRTGAHSSIDLRQESTTVSIAADTSVEIPATVSGPQLERIVQTSGNAFYSVGKRESKKLRVETPYLVAVIKGTQFNVAVQPEGATVSLFEGRLEVRAPDGSDVVDLNAGEIAVRQRNDRTIRVLRMDSGESVRNHGGAAAESNARTSGPAPSTGHTDNASGTSRDATPDSSRPSASVDTRVVGGLQIDNQGVQTGVDIGSGLVKASAELSVLPVSGDIGAGGVSVGADVGVGAGPIGVDTGASVDLGVGGGAVDVGVDTSVGVGAGAVDVGVDAAVDAGVDLGSGTVDLGVDTSVGVGAGPVDAGVDAGIDAGVDLGGGTVDLGVDTAVDIGAGPVDLGVDTGVDAGVDLGGGTVDLGTDLGVDTPVVDTGVDLGAGVGAGGVDVGADVGLGAVDLGVDLGVDSGGIDLGVDLGGGGGTAPPAATPAPEPPASEGLLGGLLGRLGRRN